MATGTWQQTFTYCYSLSPSSVSFDGCSVPVSFLNLEEELLAWIKMPRQRGLCSSSQTDMCSPLAGPRGFPITSERQVAAPFAGAFSEAEGNSVAGPCRQEVAADWVAVAGR